MKYAILERKDPDAGMPGIELENGLRFVVENIAFPEDEKNEDGSAVLSFEYTLLCDPAFPKEEYETMIGDWVTYVLNCAVEDNTVANLLGS